MGSNATTFFIFRRAAGDDEALRATGTPADSERAMGIVLRPVDTPTGIGAFGEDLRDEGKGPTGSFQEAMSVISILKLGGMDLVREQAAIGVGQGEVANDSGSTEQPNALAALDAGCGRGACAAPPGPRSPLAAAFACPF